MRLTEGSVIDVSDWFAGLFPAGTAPLSKDSAAAVSASGTPYLRPPGRPQVASGVCRFNRTAALTADLLDEARRSIESILGPDLLTQFFCPLTHG